MQQRLLHRYTTSLKQLTRCDKRPMGLVRICFHVPQVVRKRGLGVIAAGSVLLVSLPAIAQSTVQLRLPNLSAPGNRESGSTRDTTCILPNSQLTAIIPTSNYGLTQSAYPTLYFYLPPSSAPQVKFVMYHEATNKLFYEARFSLQSESGIIGITLPNNGFQAEMALNQPYVWYLAVVCNESDPGSDVVLEGRIMRVDNLVGSEQIPLPSLPALYAENGLWFDALAASAELKKSRDDSSAWNDLLNAVDLGQLTSAPLISNAPPPGVRAGVPAQQ